jgi:DNA-binding NarL/FixJ family response regulator
MNIALLPSRDLDLSESSLLATLSPAEQRVAQLVAAGLTNRQIGEQLFVSMRTVDTHVSHVFRKLNVSSRVRLALLIAA